MINVHYLTFNPFQENSYIISTNMSTECLIFDPGASNDNENKILLQYIKERNLIPTRLINTHCHIDHVLGNKLIAENFDLQLEAHRKEKVVLESCEMVSKMYGIPYDGSPPISTFLDEGDQIDFGGTVLEIFLTPGHSPGSLCFVDRESKVVIGGDVLFHGSIGRTDLPGGDFDTLIRSIREKLFTLSDDFTVYPGHGPKTTIGFERMNNPFLKD